MGKSVAYTHATRKIIGDAREYADELFVTMMIVSMRNTSRPIVSIVPMTANVMFRQSRRMEGMFVLRSGVNSVASAASAGTSIEGWIVSESFPAISASFALSAALWRERVEDSSRFGMSGTRTLLLCQQQHPQQLRKARTRPICYTLM